MATNTYTALATVTLPSNDSSITFSSIPSSYRDLVLVVTGTLINGSSSLLWRANGDSGTNYNYVEMRGDGSTGTSSSTKDENRGRFTVANVPTNQPFVLYAHFVDYSATDKFKPVLSRVNDASSLVSATMGRWDNTTAISSIELFISVYSYKAGTTLSLYGIEA